MLISRIWKGFLETGNAGRRSGHGRKRATTPNKDRYLTITARRHRNMNAIPFWQHFWSATLSTQTVRNDLHASGSACSPTNSVCQVNSKSPSSSQGVGDRACKLEKKWMAQYSFFPTGRVFLLILIMGVFLSGGNMALETILRLPTKLSDLVWWSKGQCLHLHWWAHRSPCYSKWNSGRRCRKEIFRTTVVPYAAAIGDDVILMDDNCRSYRANLVNDFLLDEGIIWMKWPACSPDMNPIQHIY